MLVARKNIWHDPFPGELIVSIERQDSKSLKTRVPGATGMKIDRGTIERNNHASKIFKKSQRCKQEM